VNLADTKLKFTQKDNLSEHDEGADNHSTTAPIKTARICLGHELDRMRLARLGQTAA
jgi:hypothetical protein